MINRAARQIALPQIGLDGQARIGAATVAVVGDDLACEAVARSLSAAGVGTLRFVRRVGTLAPELTGALQASNPVVTLVTCGWPSGAGWLATLAGAAVIVRSGFDDDPMLRAAVRTAVPVVAMRGRADRVDVVSFRRHGPCPHAPLDVPENAGIPAEDGAGAVLAAHVAAAEVLALIAGAVTGAGRARHLSIPLSSAGRPARSVDIPWAPECFVCGGSGAEMTFA